MSRPARDPGLFADCPHERPCWCGDCRLAYNRKHQILGRRRFDGRDLTLEVECPHPAPCWCPGCRSSWQRLYARKIRATPAGRAAFRKAALKTSNRRRADKLGRQSDPYTTEYLMERDGGRCHMCRARVMTELPRGAALKATVDHLIPLSCGGDDTFVNVAIACWKCNLAKGNRAVGEQLRLVG